MSNIICNENVSCNVVFESATNGTYYEFKPTDGYALWRDNEDGNLDENGQPYCYWFSINCWNDEVESYAPHIWATLIDETMEVYGNIPDAPAVMTLALDETETSHTYVDANGFVREKKGVY